MELRDRLPRLWGQVLAGAVPAWKGRQVAEQTLPLNPVAAGYVDAQLAPFAHQVGLGRILRAVDAAVLRHDPALAAERAVKAAEKRGGAGRGPRRRDSEIAAVTGTPDAVAFDQALNEVATTLGALGDLDPRQVRRAKAIGVLADPQYALDLASTSEATGAATHGTSPARRRPVGPVIGVHLHTDAFTSTAGAAGVSGQVVRVERFGPRALETVRRWLADLAPGATVRVTPVIDLTEQVSGGPGGSTSITSSPTSTATTADHPARIRVGRQARPTTATSRGCAGSTTGSRPGATGPTAENPTRP